MWLYLRSGRSYKPRLTKALYLICPAHRYLQVVLSHSITGHADSTRVVGRQELYLLQSMVDRRLIHIGHVLADFLAY